jgi:hypothetical protein
LNAPGISTTYFNTVDLNDQNKAAVDDLSKEAKRLKARLELASLKIRTLEEKASQAGSQSPESVPPSEIPTVPAGVQPRV